MSMDNIKSLKKRQAIQIINLLKEHRIMNIAEFREYTGLSTNTLELILKELIRKEIVYLLGRDKYSLNINYQNTLCISLYRVSKRMHLTYRVYNVKDEIRVERDIIKKYIHIENFYDIIDTVLSQFSDIKIIGISLPGIIVDGYISSTGIDDFDNIDLKRLLSIRYSQKILLSNDVNSAAVGFYVTQNDYDNIAVLFQPVVNLAGIGIVINGKLIEGKSHIAGEAQYMPINFTKDNRLELLNSPEGFEELLIKYVQNIMAMINPDIIGISCAAVKDYTNIVDGLKKVFPKANDLPELVQLDNLSDYILSGLNVLCKERLEGE